jgi:hypothetical protein
MPRKSKVTKEKNKKQSIWKNPTVMVAIIGAVATIIAAIISKPIPTASEPIVPSITPTILVKLQVQETESASHSPVNLPVFGSPALYVKGWKNR